MPSYQYLRDIKPEDLQPEEKPDYSKKDKAKNWWRYHRVIVLVVIIAVLVVAFFVRDMVTRVQPDINIGVVTPYALPNELVEKIQVGLAESLPDLNGDSKITAQVSTFTIQAQAVEDASGNAASVPAVTSGSEASQAAGMTDPYVQMAGVTQLSGAFMTGDPIIYISEPSQAQYYQQQFSLFALPDGHYAGEEADPMELTVAFKDVPALAALDLKFEYLDGTVYDGQEILAEFRVGIRGLYDTSLEKKEEDVQRWHTCQEVLASWME